MNVVVKALLIVGAIFLLLAYLIPVVAPLPSGCSEASCNNGGPNGNTPYASLSIGQSTLNLGSAAGATASTEFTLYHNVSVSLVTVGLESFHVNVIPGSGSLNGSGTYSGTLTVTEVNGVSFGTYPFSFRAMDGDQIVASVSMKLVFSNSSSSSGSTSTTTTTTSASSTGSSTASSTGAQTTTSSSSNQNSNLDFGLFSSYSVHLTRTIIGDGGRVISTTPLYSLFPTTPSTSAQWINYTLTVQATLGSGVTPPPGSQFVVEFVTFGAGGTSLSPADIPPLIAQGNGWGAYEFLFSIPITGGRQSFLLNVTSMIDGTYAAANQIGSTCSLNGVPNAGICWNWNEVGGDQELAIGLDGLEGTPPFYAVDTNVSVTNAQQVVSVIAQTSYVDMFPLPGTNSQSSSNAGSTSTTTTTTSVIYGCNSQKTQCKMSLLPQALNVASSGSISYQLKNVFGFSDVLGTPMWSIYTSDVLLVLGIVLVVGMAAASSKYD